MTNIPTLSELQAEILNDLEVQFGVNVPPFGKNFLRVLSLVQAGKLWLFYKALGLLQKNIFVDTAQPEAIGGTLERFGRVKLNRDPFPARAGLYDITVTGDIGAVIPAQTTFKSDDDSQNPGKLFILDAEHTLIATSDTIQVRALELGVDAQMDIGETMTATAPIINVDKQATVAVEVQEPSAAETIEDYRAKVLQAFRLEPQGGAPSDYRLWAADAQGVKQVYPYAKSSAYWEVNLFVEATIADSLDGKGTPSPALLDDVEEVVDMDPDTTLPDYERGRRPINVVVNYLAVTPLDVNITIADFVDSTTEIETAISTALTADIALVRPFIAASDILSEKNDILDTNRIIANILSTRPGSVFGAITLEVDGSTVSTYQFLNGDIPYVNSITFV